MMFLEDIKIGVCDGDTLFVFQIARFVVRILQIAVPFALIIWGSLDFFKAVIAGDEKEMKQKRKPFISRVIAALIILLLPSLVNLIIANVSDKNQVSFAKCWTDAESGAQGKFTKPEAKNNDVY